MHDKTITVKTVYAVGEITFEIDFQTRRDSRRIVVKGATHSNPNVSVVLSFLQCGVVCHSFAFCLQGKCNFLKILSPATSCLTANFKNSVGGPNSKVGSFAYPVN